MERNCRSILVQTLVSLEVQLVPTMPQTRHHYLEARKIKLAVYSEETQPRGTLAALEGCLVEDLSRPTNQHPALVFLEVRAKFNKPRQLKVSLTDLNMKLTKVCL